MCVCVICCLILRLNLLMIPLVKMQCFKSIRGETHAHTHTAVKWQREAAADPIGGFLLYVEAEFCVTVTMSFYCHHKD